MSSEFQNLSTTGKQRIRALFAFFLVTVCTNIAASELQTPVVFQNNEVADADKMNANFVAHEQAINDNDSRITSNEDVIADWSGRLSYAVSLIINGNGSTQYSSLNTVSVSRTGLASYQIVIPDGTWSSGQPVWTVMPIGKRYVNGSFSQGFSNGGATISINFRDFDDNPVDTLFTINIVGNRD